MFEHLSPPVEARKLASPSQLKLYLPFLFLAFFIFIFIFSASHGPSGQASGDPLGDFSADFIFENFDKQLTVGINNVSLFDFVLETKQAGASLYKMKISLEGLYDLELLDKLKLYHGQTQLGTIKTIDEDGSLYFQLTDYFLPAGQNHFSLRLTDSSFINPGTAFNFIIKDKADLALKYKGGVIFPTGDFPASSGLLVFLDHGYLGAFVDNNSEYFLASDLPQKIASFSLLNYGESADLSSLTISYQGDQDISGSSFVLIKDDKFLVQSQAEAGKVEFFLQSRENINKLKFFEVYALDLPEGNFSFQLDSAEAVAYNSGQIIGLSKPLFLGDYQVRPYYLQLQNGFFNSQLAADWNQIYELELRAVGQDDLAVYKLSWEVDYQGLELEDWELWLDNQPSISDLSLENNQLIAKADWNKPWLVSDKGTKITLLAKAKNLDSKAKISARLLTDDKILLADSLDGRIIWSDGNNFFNSYRLPYLPLVPSILTK